MVEAVALVLVLLGAGWLAIVAFVCLLAPKRAQQGLAAMGSSWRVQLGEHIPRALVGGALIIRAPLSKAPLALDVAGWFILASSIVILLLPMRWHNAYARYWAERIPITAYRLLALPTLAMAVLLAYITI